LQENDYCYLDKEAIEALLAGKPVVAMGDEFPILIEMQEKADDLTIIAEFDGKKHDYTAEQSAEEEKW